MADALNSFIFFYFIINQVVQILKKWNLLLFLKFMYATSLFSSYSLLKFVKILFSSVVHHEKKITFELQGDRIPSILKGSYTGDVFITNRRVIFFFQSISLSPSLSSSMIVSKGAVSHFKQAIRKYIVSTALLTDMATHPYRGTYPDKGMVFWKPYPYKGTVFFNSFSSRALEIVQSVIKTNEF